MLSPKSSILFLSIITVIFFSCQPAATSSNSRTPGVYHIRIEMGNSWAGREDEIYIDYDSSKTVQSMNHFKYDAADSIVYNKSYKLENSLMDSLFLYSAGAVRSANIFDYDKYAPSDGHTVTVEIIANDRMIQCTYTNIQVASHASLELGKLARLINACAENNTLIK